VEQELSELGVYAQGGKLFAASGKEVYFYERWTGGPPSPGGGWGGVDFIRRTSDGKKWETTDLAKLRKRYVLIEFRVHTP
jgi:hypothetical protein